MVLSRLFESVYEWDVMILVSLTAATTRRLVTGPSLIFGSFDESIFIATISALVMLLTESSITILVIGGVSAKEDTPSKIIYGCQCVFHARAVRFEGEEVAAIK